MGGVCCPACGQGIQLFAPNTGVLPVGLESRLRSFPLKVSDAGRLTGGARKLAADTGLPLLGRLPFDTKLGRAAERGVALAEVLVRFLMHSFAQAIQL